MALPFLPGNSFDKNIGKEKFHKSHAFDYRENNPIFFGEAKPGIGGEVLPGQSPHKNVSSFPKGVGREKPTWVAFDKQVLRFYAYFQETVQEKREELYRTRYCNILFHLEDDTIQVNEQKTENSGIPQGTLIRRHRIPRPPPNEDQFYTVEDFNVGNQIVMYSKIFQIVDCDGFTRNFLRKLGVKVRDPLDMPSDPYTEHREKLVATMQPLRPYEKLDTLKQFLEHDRQVLRFFCYWDDTDSMFGDLHELELHYFLADDTVEVLEKVLPNSGREAIPMFLKRAPLPKEPVPLHQPGVQTKKTVLNVFGPTGQGGRYIFDSHKTGAVHTDYYRENDFCIGAVINVWGRKAIVCDCDEYTKNFYRTKYGITHFEPIKIAEPPPPAKKRELPPYNGIGSDEDSLSSCLYLIPKPPRKDFARFMEKDRQGLDSNILRFVAQLETTRPIDIDRRFIIFYYLSDGTITVYEPPQRNSGIIGGKFLERSKQLNTSSMEGKSAVQSPVYYQAEDLYIGGTMELCKHKFKLIDADEYALRYMENNADQFPHANVSLILAKLKGPASSHISAVKTAFAEVDVEKTGKISIDKFRNLVRGLSHGLLNEHEIITLGRHYGERKTPPLTSLIPIVQHDLKRNNYKEFTQLLNSLLPHEKDGYIEQDMLKYMCKTLQVPLNDQLIDGIIMNCEKNANGYIDYRQFLAFLNWVEHPFDETNLQTTSRWKGPWSGFGDNRETVTMINYSSLLADLSS